MLRRLLQTYPLTATTLWAVLILLLCATPGRYVPTTHWLELISFDKIVHAGIFFVLGSLSLYSLEARARRRRLRLVVVALCVLYGALLEWMQAHVFSERSADVFDIAANTAGCVFALIFRRQVQNRITSV